jgi:hypothetical protein
LHGEQYYQTAEAYFKDFADLYAKGRLSFSNVGALMFEHAATNQIGVGITKYVEENNLGIVHVLPSIPNPVHQGRKFLVYTWVHDSTKLRKHCLELAKSQKASPPAAPSSAEKAA